MILVWKLPKFFLPTHKTYKYMKSATSICFLMQDKFKIISKIYFSSKRCFHLVIIIFKTVSELKSSNFITQEWRSKLEILKGAKF